MVSQQEQEKNLEGNGSYGGYKWHWYCRREHVRGGGEYGAGYVLAYLQAPLGVRIRAHTNIQQNRNCGKDMYKKKWLTERRCRMIDRERTRNSRFWDN